MNFDFRNIYIKLFLKKCIWRTLFLLVMIHVIVCVEISCLFFCSLVVTCWEKADLLAAVCRVCCVLLLSKMRPGPHQNQG